MTTAAFAVATIFAVAHPGQAQPTMATAPYAVTTASPDEMLDYRILNNPTFSFTDIKMAKARDFNDDTIAGVLKLAEMSGYTFRYVSNLLISTGSFYMVTDKLGLPISSFHHVDRQKDEIAAYESAYEATGKYSVSRQDIAGAVKAGEDRGGNRSKY